MTSAKTVLEWPYQPPDFFEASYGLNVPDCEILVDGGMVTVTLASPQDPVPEILKSEIASMVEALFRARQLGTHRQFHLDSPRVVQHTADGRKFTSIAFEGTGSVIFGGTADSIFADSTGKVICDSKAERIAADTRFVDELAPRISRSPLLESLLGSYGAAVNDSANELVHLYEIRDALVRHYGSEHETRRQLGITESDWRRFGRLANAEPVAQSRHRGQHLASIRPATQAELEEARRIARRLILAYAGTV